MRRTGVGVLAGVGDDVDVGVGGAFLHLLPRTATFGGAASVVVPAASIPF